MVSTGLLWAVISGSVQIEVTLLTHPFEQLKPVPCDSERSKVVHVDGAVRMCRAKLVRVEASKADQRDRAGQMAELSDGREGRDLIPLDRDRQIHHRVTHDICSIDVPGQVRGSEAGKARMRTLGKDFEIKPQLLVGVRLFRRRTLAQASSAIEYSDSVVAVGDVEATGAGEVCIDADSVGRSQRIRRRPRL